MSVLRRIPLPRPWMVALVASLVALALAGVAIAQDGDKPEASDDRGYATAVWRGASPGFGMVVKSDTTDQLTSSQSWSDVPGMVDIKYNIHPNAVKDQNLLITYSDDHNCFQSPAASAFCLLRVLVDGVPATPSLVIFDSVGHTAADGSTFPWATQSVQFVAGPYGPGQHLVTVQWMVDEANTTFDSNSRTLSVMGFHSNAVNIINP